MRASAHSPEIFPVVAQIFDDRLKIYSSFCGKNKHINRTHKFRNFYDFADNRHAARSSTVFVSFFYLEAVQQREELRQSRDDLRQYRDYRPRKTKKKKKTNHALKLNQFLLDSGREICKWASETQIYNRTGRKKNSRATRVSRNAEGWTRKRGQVERERGACVCEKLCGPSERGDDATVVRTTSEPARMCALSPVLLSRGWNHPREDCLTRSACQPIPELQTYGGVW